MAKADGGWGGRTARRLFRGGAGGGLFQWGAGGGLTIFWLTVRLLLCTRHGRPDVSRQTRACMVVGRQARRGQAKGVRQSARVDEGRGGEEGCRG